MVDDHRQEWDASYQRQENFVFWPHEEVIRFLARYVRRRTGVDSYEDRLAEGIPPRLLDLGCGLGRHVMLGHEVGLDSFGVDLSAVAIDHARQWGASLGLPEPHQRLKVSDARTLPFASGFFGVTVSHGVLDSMPFSFAKATVADVARVMAPGGWFYFDCVSGEGTEYGDDFAGEVVVEGTHEQGTVQSYFNDAKLLAMLDGYFEVRDHIVVTSRDARRGTFARHHMVVVRTS